jgi:gas vesicle protein
MNHLSSTARVGVLLAAAAWAAAPGLVLADTPADSAQHAQQDLKDAGHAVADTAKEGAQKVKQAVEEGKEAVKETVHKGAEKVEEGARKVEEKTRGE